MIADHTARNSAVPVPSAHAVILSSLETPDHSFQDIIIIIITLMLAYDWRRMVRTGYPEKIPAKKKNSAINSLKKFL